MPQLNRRSAKTGVGQLLRGRGAREVGVHRHDGHALGRELGERRPVGRTRGLLLLGLGPVCKLNHGIDSFPAPPSSAASASAACSAFGAFPCQPASFSMNGTPLPLTVRAMTACGRAVATGLRSPEHRHEGVQVVAVDLRHVPAERRELRAQIAGVAHVAGAPVDLQAVAVDDGHEVVQLAVRREHGGLPHLALLALAVAQQREHRLGGAVQLQAGRGPRRDGQPLSERARGHLHAGHLVRVRDGPAAGCPACAAWPAPRAGSSPPGRARRRAPAPRAPWPG